MTDSSTGDAGRDPRFDPRFDPAFQPGYDPRLHGHAPAGASAPQVDAAREPVRESVDRIGRPPARAEADAALADAALAAERTNPALAAETTETAVTAETTGTTETTKQIEPSSSIRRFDPYLMALWVVSAAFVAAGLLVVRYIADRLDTLNATGGGGTFNYYLLQVYTIGAPLLIVLGVSTATGTLFVLAARRRR